MVNTAAVAFQCHDEAGCPISQRGVDGAVLGLAGPSPSAGRGRMAPRAAVCGPAQASPSSFLRGIEKPLSQSLTRMHDKA